MSGLLCFGLLQAMGLCEPYKSAVSDALGYDSTSNVFSYSSLEDTHEGSGKTSHALQASTCSPAVANSQYSALATPMLKQHCGFGKARVGGQRTQVR